MPNKKSAGKNQLSTVAAVTLFFLAFALVLTFMTFRVVTSMRDAANEIDDARALKAVQAAVTSATKNLEATVRDNAEWDDAYSAVGRPDAYTWVDENWGKTTEDYDLYDAAVVTNPDGSVMLAKRKGEEIDPFKYYGDQFTRQVASVSLPERPPVSNLIRLGDAIMIMSSQPIQPYANEPEDRGYHVLTLIKTLDSETLAIIADDYKLPGLKLELLPSPVALSQPLSDMDGNTIAYLTWPSERPGSKIYEKVYPLLISSTALLGVFLVAVLVVGATVAWRLQRHARLARYDAIHDSLSGLLNRQGFLDEVDHIQSRKFGNRIAVLHLIDLDGFKAVNDTWGHGVGDELIREVANSLRSVSADVLAAARLGGDEFAVIQSGDTDPHVFGQNLVERLSTPYPIKGMYIEVGASIGFSYLDPAIDVDELMRRADVALYEVKDNGKGRAVGYRPELERGRTDNAMLENSLRSALENNEIKAHFQPLADARTGRIIGVEALARWVSPVGPVSPEVFIPVAEKAGLIDRLGAAVLKETLQAASQWDGIGVSVNVSPQQLNNPNFAEDVLAEVKAADFEASRLTLEITEGVLLKDAPPVHSNFERLKAAGIAIALDDFGSGYASVGTMQNFGFSRMKIDRSIVSASDREGKGADLLRATISLANALDVPTTAEGIETATQADIARAAGCDQLQGFAVAKPMSAEDVTRYLAKSRTPALSVVKAG